MRKKKDKVSDEIKLTLKFLKKNHIPKAIRKLLVLFYYFPNLFNSQDYVIRELRFNVPYEFDQYVRIPDEGFIKLFGNKRNLCNGEFVNINDFFRELKL